MPDPKDKRGSSAWGPAGGEAFPYPVDDEMVVKSIRLSQMRYEALVAHGKRRGLDFTSLVREILYAYIDNHRLHPPERGE
jgi:hypothetical protein